MTGISFTLITLRVGLGKTFNRWMQTTTTSGMHSSRKTGGKPNLIPMHVHITHEQDIAPDLKLGSSHDTESGYGVGRDPSYGSEGVAYEAQDAGVVSSSWM